MSEFNKRLEALETANRRLRRCLFLLTVVATVAVSMGASNCWYKCIRSERFVLVDSTGKQRAVLGLNEGGHPELVMHTQNGQGTQAAFGLTNRGHGHLRMLGANGRGVAKMSATPDNQTIEFGDSKLISLTYSGNGPRITLNAENEAKLEIGRLSTDWVIRTAKSNGEYTELHREPLQ